MRERDASLAAGLRLFLRKGEMKYQMCGNASKLRKG